MASLNRVTILGNLTRDVETHTTQSGMTIAKLGVAVNDRVKKDGEWTDHANFFDVTCFGKTAEVAAQYLSKGRQVAVDGRLRWSSWTTEGGDKRSKVEIIADQLVFVGGKADKDTNAPMTPQQAAEHMGGSVFEDDIPF